MSARYIGIYVCIYARYICMYIYIYVYLYIYFDVLHVTFSDAGREGEGRRVREKGRNFFFFSLSLFFFLLSVRSGCGTCGMLNFSQNYLMQ